MGMLTEGLKIKVQQLANHKIKHLLLDHLVEDKDNPSELFTNHFTNDRNTIPTQQDLEENHIIALVYKYAPTGLCEKLTELLLKVQNTEFVRLLSHETKAGDESLLYTLLNCAPDSSRRKITENLRTLREDEIINLLFCSPNSTTPNIINFLKLTNSTDQQSVISLIEALSKIDKKRLLPLLLPDGFIALFKQKPSDELALALLKLLDGYERNDLLKLIQGSSQNFLNYSKSTNLLHIIFNSQSKAIVSEFLKILGNNLSDVDIKYMLSKRDEYNRTPIESAFVRNDQSGVDTFLIGMLYTNEQLRPLLTEVSLLQPMSIMHTAVAEKRVEVVACYLEQPGAKFDQLNDSATTSLQDLAQAKGFKAITDLFRALPLLNLAKTKLSELPVEKIEAYIKADQSILQSRWMGNKTLLHHAASQGHTTLVELFLKYGLPTNLKDSEGRTAVDEALDNNHLDTLKSLTLNLKLTTVYAFADALNQAPQPINTYEGLENMLREGKPASLQAYCSQFNDSYIYFLTEIARLFLIQKRQTNSEHIKNDSTLENAIKIYIKNNLQTLQSSTPLQQNAIQLHLIILLFSLPTKERIVLLSSLTLSHQEKTQLSLVLSRALIYPGVYKNLRRIDYQQNYQLIRQLVPHDPTVLESIANIHLQKANLSDFPVETLKEFATISRRSLVQFTNQRICPILIALTLEELLNNTPPAQMALDPLFMQLKHELQLIDQDPFGLPHSLNFQYILNLATTPRLKAFIRQIIGKTAPNLKSSLSRLVLNAVNTTDLLPNSLLSELMSEYACSSELLLQPEHHRALSEVLAVASPENASSMIRTIQKNLLPKVTAASLLLVGAFEPGNEALTLWFYRLESKSKRLDLAPLIVQIDKFHARALQFCSSLTEDKYLSLHESITNLANCLNEISSYLFEIHLDQKNSSWDSRLENSLSKLNLILGQIQTQFSENKSGLKSDFHSLPAELNRFISSEELTSLSSKISSLCQGFDDLEQRIADYHRAIKIKQSESSSNLNLSTIEETNLLLNRISQHVLAGILRNPHCNQLLPQLFDWIFSCGSEISSETLYQNMSQLTGTTQPHDWLEVDKQIDYLLSLRNEVMTVLLDLQIALISPPATLDSLLLSLYNNDEAVLQKTAELCSLAQLHEFKAVIHYVITAKRNNIQLELLKIDAPLKISDVSNWIHHNLTAIDSYANRAISFKALKAGIYLENMAGGKLQAKEAYARAASFDEMLEANIANPGPKAIIALISSHIPMLTATPRSLEHRLFILKLHSLFKHTKSSIVAETVSQMPSEMLELILEQCLLGLNGEDKTAGNQENRLSDEACRSLLNNLCIYSQSNENSLNLIKERLGQQDLGVLGDDKLVAIAKEILAESGKCLTDYTLNAIWIQRLLVNPRFVAALTSCSTDTAAKILQTLSDRYRYYSMILKQDEYDRLSQFLKGKMKFSDDDKASMEKLRNEILADPIRKDHHLKRLQNILEFRADDCIRALFNQLEDNCHELQESCPEIAKAALEVLSTHYNNRIAGVRSDLLFKIADYIVSNVSQNKGDLEQDKSKLVTWLKTYLPHKNFEQTELARKQQVFLYNEKRQKIGFINEANYAMTLGVPPHPLLGQQGIIAGTRFFDSQRRVIGTLTTTGQIQHENLFQKQTSALLLATVPTEQLEESPETLYLLMSDVLTENAVDDLYEKANPNKHAWITEQIQRQLISTSRAVPKESLHRLAQSSHPDSFFTLLAHIKLQENAEQFFELILADPIQRHELLTDQRKQKLVFDFFARHDTSLLLAHYLINHKEHPWFSQGFQLFGLYAHKTSQPDLLIRALAHLGEYTFVQKTLAEQEYDSILTKLISCQACASVIWQYFLNATSLTNIQDIDSELSTLLTSCFFKHHCLPAINELNKQGNLTQTAQHRLLILIFAKQREQLFHPQELRFSSKMAWSQNELEQMTIFVKRHFHQHANADKNLGVGKELLSELVFRCASFGLTSLFYQNDRLDPTIATQTLDRSLLNAIAAKDYLPKELKEKINDIYSIIIGWFDNQHIENKRALDQLKEHHAIIDWKELSNQAWEVNDSMTQMPLISAYLINYSGKQGALVKLIKDYVSHPMIKTKPAYLKHISQVMAKFPQRDLSNCIFTALEELVTENPNYLSEDLLDHMAKFYTSKFPEKTKKKFSPEINLINHFGQQQKYGLVMRSCELLEMETLNTSAQDLLRKINREAKVESFLFQHKSSWYFPILQFFLRLLSYGLNGETNASKVVTFCDRESDYSSPAVVPQLIRTPVKSGEEIEQAKTLAENTGKLRVRYEKFLKAEQLRKAKEEKKAQSATHSPYRSNLSPVHFAPRQGLECGTEAALHPELRYTETLAAI